LTALLATMEPDDARRVLDAAHDRGPNGARVLRAIAADQHGDDRAVIKRIAAEGRRGDTARAEADRALAACAAMARILWPPGDEDQQWEVDTIEHVAAVLDGAGFAPPAVATLAAPDRAGALRAAREVFVTVAVFGGPGERAGDPEQLGAVLDALGWRGRGLASDPTTPVDGRPALWLIGTGDPIAPSALDVLAIELRAAGLDADTIPDFDGETHAIVVIDPVRAGGAS
jgi:hypothetical protein